MTHPANVAAPAFTFTESPSRAESGSFLRGFVGSAVLLMAINASERLFFGEGYFSTLAYHPFWIVILLAAVQHGLFVGLSTVALATMMMDWPSRPVGIDITEHYVDIATAPAQWLVVALLIGLYRQQQLARDRALDRENDRLRDINRTLAEEIHRLDAFVARAELAAATRVAPAQDADPACRLDLLKALERLSEADASERSAAFVTAAQACLPTPIVWLDLDDGRKLRPAATSHDEIRLPDPAPADVLDSAPHRPVRFAPGEGLAPLDQHALCCPVLDRNKQPAGALVALTRQPDDLEAMEPALVVLCRALEDSLGQTPRILAVPALPAPTADTEPALAHA
jgi:hypothetical protein